MRETILKYVKLEDDIYIGTSLPQLRTTDGVPVPAFHYCMQNCLDLKPNTRRRYKYGLARFFDYLYATGAFSPDLTLVKLNDILAAYPMLLSLGSQVFGARVRRGKGQLWLADAVDGLKWKSLKPSSVSNSLAAANKLIKLSSKLAETARSKAMLYGMEVIEGPLDVVVQIGNVIDEPEFSFHQSLAIKQNTLLGNVSRVCPKLKRSRNALSYQSKTVTVFAERNFPFEYFLRLVATATCWRDKLLWLVLGALGLRISEALNIQMSHIDFVRQEIYVIDPTGTRKYIDIGDDVYERFKGRATCYTVAIPSLKDKLFLALENYLKNEWVPVTSPLGEKYLFQYVDPMRRGMPYITVSYTNLSKRFKKAAERAGAPTPRFLDSPQEHSLRHMYGVHMLNDQGVPLGDLQVMMGHLHLSSTAKYARPTLKNLRASLEASDESLFLSNEEIVASITRR